MTSDKYRLVVNGVETVFSWDTCGEAVRGGAIACEISPHLEIRVRRPDIVLQRARPYEED